MYAVPYREAISHAQNMFNKIKRLIMLLDVVICSLGEGYATTVAIVMIYINVIAGLLSLLL